MIKNPHLTYVIIGSGPSLTQEQIDLIKTHSDRLFVIAVNNNYKLAPWCDYVLAGDIRWWRKYYDDVCDTVDNAQLHTIQNVKPALFKNKKERVPLYYDYITRNIEDIGKDVDKMYHGGCSGILAMELVRLEDTFIGQHNTKIILVGFDMQHTNGKAHWFGDHPSGFLNFNCAERWCSEIEKIIPYYNKLGIEVVNCSIESAINSEIVRRSTLEKEFAKWK